METDPIAIWLSHWSKWHAEDVLSDAHPVLATPPTLSFLRGSPAVNHIALNMWVQYEFDGQQLVFCDI